MKRLFTDEEEKQICEDYFSEEKPATDTLAEKWGCSQLTISHVIRRNGYNLRTKSEAHLGKNVWITGLTKETNESVKRMSESLSKFTKEEEKQICKQYIEDKLTTFELAKKYKCNPETIGNIVRRNGYILRTSEESCKLCTKKQEFEICKEYFSGRKPSSLVLAKEWNCSAGTICNIINRNGYALRSINVLISLKNGYGNNCYYDNEFFPSNAERDCYIELRKLGFKVKHNFERRFDFLINDKIVLEFHPFDFNLTDEQYYIKRRKLLDKYGYKDLKLVVIKDLEEIENKLGNEI